MKNKYKISIIIGVYKDILQMKNFVKKLSLQTSQDFDIVCVLDSVPSRDLHELDSFFDFFGDRIKLIINLKRQGRENIITAGLQEAQGQYSQIISIHDVFEKNYIEKLCELIKPKQTDVIEFAPSFKGAFRWKPKPKFISSEKIMDIQDDPNIIAFSFPVYSNKLFKTSIAIDVTIPYNWIKLDSRLSISWLYAFLDVAKTYEWINQELLILDIKKTDNSFNPSKFIKQWSDIIGKYSIKSPLYKQSIQYAALYHITLFIMKLTIEICPPATIQRYVDKINKKINKIYKNAFSTNSYLMLNNGDNKYLEKTRTAEQYIKDARIFK